MKRNLLVLLLVVSTSLIAGLSKSQADLRFSAGLQINSVADFYTPLQPYGAWVTVGSYGRCWHPNVERIWRPYATGQWEWTDCGWYWASDDPWAWACYHYGSWVYDSYYGWVWIPATEWAPAWVTWRESDDYIGWAPCGPGGIVLAPSLFTFIDIGHFRDRISPDRVIVNDSRIINRTTVVNNFRRETRTIDGSRQVVTINPGPSPTRLQRVTGTSLTPVPITQVARQTPVPSTVRHSAWRDRVVQEPTRTGREQPQVYPQQQQTVPNREREQAPAVIPQAPERSRQTVPAPTVPGVPREERPRQIEPSQIQPERPPGPTGRERGYQQREERVPPPAQAVPPQPEAPREHPPVRQAPPPVAPPPQEQERGRDRDRDRDHP